MKMHCNEAILFLVIIIELSMPIVFSSSGLSSIRIAKVGEPIQLKCPPGLSRDRCPEWGYRRPNDPVHGFGDRELCSSCNNNVEKYKEGFDCKSSDNSGAINLTIQRVASDDAGTYLCRSDDALTLHMTTLIVTDDLPRCSSNVSLSELIGPNDCIQRLSADSVRLSCSAEFHGTGPDIWPLLQWRIDGKETPLNSTCVRNSTTVTCILEIEASTHLMGKSFICSNFGNIHKCQMGPIRVLYAFNQSDPTLIKATYLGWTVVCKANTNSESCSYKWKEVKPHSNGNEDAKTVSNSSTMALSTPGRYRCEARCSLQGHTCLIFPISINVQAAPVAAPRKANLTETITVSMHAVAKSTKPSYLVACLSVILLIISKHL